MDPEAVEETDPEGRPRHLARFRLGGDLFLKPAVLDLSTSCRSVGSLQSTLLRRRAGRRLRPGPDALADLRCRPTTWPLAPEGGAAVRWTVGLRGWLLAPQLAVTGKELEHWFAGADAPAWPTGAAVVAGPGLLAGRRPAADRRLLPGVGLDARSARCRWCCSGCSCSRLVCRSYAGGRARPSGSGCVALPAAGGRRGRLGVPPDHPVYAVAFGCEPGAAVLLLVLAFQVLMLERYRRRIVFLPNFRRARSGSSLVRTSRRHTGRPANRPPWTPRVRRAAASSRREGRQGDRETWRRGDRETGRHGDEESRR